MLHPCRAMRQGWSAYVYRNCSSLSFLPDGGWPTPVEAKSGPTPFSSQAQYFCPNSTVSPQQFSPAYTQSITF